MNSKQTLFSKLRVLVAKTYRAEKLYSTLRHSLEVSVNEINLSDSLRELANNVRSKEWQRQHEDLRLALNELVSNGNTPDLAKRVVGLRNKFESELLVVRSQIENDTSKLVEATKRNEFHFCFKLSLELAKKKARSQALQVITDELTGIIDSSGNSHQDPISYVPNKKVVNGDNSQSFQSNNNMANNSIEKKQVEVIGESKQQSNVVHLSRINRVKRRFSK